MKRIHSTAGQGITGKSMMLVAILLMLPAAWASAGENQDAGMLTLADCVERALKSNPGLRSSEMLMRESKERIREARAGFYPSLSISATAGRYDYEDTGGATGQTSRENYQAGIYARYPLFEGFRRIAGSDAAEANFSAEEERYRQNRRDLELEVTNAYYLLLKAERLVGSAEKSSERSKVYLEYAEARFENGLASRSDVLKAMVERSDADLALIRARNGRLVAAGLLNVVMGRSAQEPVRIVDNLEAGLFAFPEDSLVWQTGVERLIEAALSNRPDLARMEGLIEAQRAALRMARSDYYPTISLDGNYTYFGEEATDLRGGSYIGLSVSLPLFSGFSRPARTAREGLALRGLEQERASLRHQVGLEVWFAYLNVKEANERILSNETFYENAVENLRIARGEYKEGMGSMLDLLDAETALVTAEVSRIESLADFQISLAELIRAVGREDIKEIIR